MKQLASLAIVLVLSAASNAAQRTSRSAINPPADPVYTQPHCLTWVAPAATVGQYEMSACMGLQACSMWSREYCSNAMLNFNYDHGGMCMFLCPGDGTFGDSMRICNGPVCQ